MVQARAGRRQAGNTFVGFVAGLICGLAVAVAVALFITKAPIPFVDKGNGRQPDATPIAGAQLPDPNKPFYPKESTPPAATPTPPTAGAAPAADAGKKVSFYDLAPAKPADKPADKAAPAKPDAAKPDAAKPAADDGKTRYLLQAGAFKSEADADAMKARLALLGYTAAVSTAEKDGTTLYRVRVGPIAKLDEMNRVRQAWAKAGIDASVISIK